MALALPRPEIAEGFAVFALVLFGGLALVANALTGGAVGHVGIALTFALVILVMVYAIGHVSGAHINPAVTIAFAATGHFPWRRVPSYVAAQCLGGLLAAWVLVWTFPTEAVGTVTALGDGVGVANGIVLEALATALLCFVIASVATDARAEGPAAGLAIGLSIGVGAISIGALTGGSLNPARSLGPALVTGEFAHLWLYLVAPVLGGVAAMGLYELLRPGEVPEPESVEEPALDDAEAGEPA